MIALDCGWAVSLDFSSGGLHGASELFRQASILSPSTINQRDRAVTTPQHDGFQCLWSTVSNRHARSVVEIFCGYDGPWAKTLMPNNYDNVLRTVHGGTARFMTIQA